jgi:prepilin-type N-terminal cleavage/methylation domain-containing protein
VTLRAGTSTEKTPPLTTGFTLIELVVVMAILASVLLIAFPGMGVLDDFAFRSETRRMAGLFRYLDDRATIEGQYYRVWFYPEDDSFRVESSTDGQEFRAVTDPDIQGHALGASTDMEDVQIVGLGTITRGEAAVIFNPAAGADPFSLHLRRDKESITLRYNPYSGKVRILRGHV